MSAGRFALLLVGLSLALVGASWAQPAAGPLPLDKLLEEVRSERAQGREEQRRREAEFERRKGEQARLLAEVRKERVAAERRSASLEAEFQQNERELAQLEEQRANRLGSLGELFGVVRQVAGETRAHVASSLVSAQIPERDAPLAALAESKRLPKMDQLVQLWFALQQEATESAKVLRFRAPVVGPDGSAREREVLRIGAFTALSDEGDFLVYSGGSLREMVRQPRGRAARTARGFASATHTAVAPIDPSRGSILALEVQRPTLREQIAQGGAVGGVILGIGLLGGLLAAWRFVALFTTGRAMDSAETGDANPLGRVLSVYDGNLEAETATLELKLDEAVMREVPRLERGLTVIRVFSVIAPLLGLLGTVTGMIQTFQMITLFGTGDPKLMAGGISEALVTTMLGLCVAIPLIFVHSLLRDRSRGLVELLEERAAGMLAERAEASR